MTYAGASLDAVVPRISVLDADPELLRYVTGRDADRARRTVTAPLVVLAEGPFEPAQALSAGRQAFGGLILEGLVAREITLGAQPTLQLLGPGDLIHGVPLEVGVAPAADLWSASLPTRVALLDDRFLQAVHHWPRLLTALYERAAAGADATLLQLAASHHPRVEDRLVALFSVLAARWGRVTPHGVSVPLALTHEALARLVGARRPTVTLALKVLAADGRLQRRDDTWLLALPTPAEPPPLEPLTGKARPRLLANMPPPPPPPPPRPSELLRRTRTLADEQRRLSEHSRLVAETSAEMRRRTRALIEEGQEQRRVLEQRRDQRDGLVSP